MAGAVATTHAGHIGSGAPGTGGGRVGSELQYATAAQTNLDGNSVDMDRERASFADNAIKYEATLRFINSNVRTSLSAITGQ
jgi:flagellar basal-body rod protein FlgB